MADERASWWAAGLATRQAGFWLGTGTGRQAGGWTDRQMDRGRVVRQAGSRAGGQVPTTAAVATKPI